VDCFVCLRLNFFTKRHATRVIYRLTVQTLPDSLETQFTLPDTTQTALSCLVCGRCELGIRSLSRQLHTVHSCNRGRFTAVSLAVADSAAGSTGRRAGWALDEQTASENSRHFTARRRYDVPRSARTERSPRGSGVCDLRGNCFRRNLVVLFASPVTWPRTYTRAGGRT